MIKSLWVVISVVGFVVSLAALGAVVAVAGLMTLPDVRQLEKCFTTSMYGVRLCSSSENYVKLRDVSPYVLHAVIVSEDGTFYSHDGFDWHEMQASFEEDLRAGHIRRGGSTITQQLAKNAFLDKEKSLWRKLKEAYLAHAIEKRYKKDFILEKYLNVVEFGDGIYGVRPAALYYFHKNPSELNPLEAAYLAFLLPNPKGYSKNFRLGKLTPFTRKSLTVILKRMTAYGKLSPEGYQTAMLELPNFPWRGLGTGSFHGAPTYSLDAPALPPGAEVDPVGEEQALDEVVNETDDAARLSPPPAAAQIPPEVVEPTQSKATPAPEVVTPPPSEQSPNDGAE